MIVEGILLWTNVVIAIASSISALTAFGALIFAIKGFENLKGQLRQLKRQNDLNEEKMRRSTLPICELKYVNSKGDLVLEYEITVNGFPAHEFSLYKVLPNENIPIVEKIDVLKIGESYKFSVDHKKEESFELIFYYRNYLYDCYEQKAGVPLGKDPFEKTPYTLPPVKINC